VEAKPYKIPHPFRKLTKKLIDIIVQDIADGSTHKLACLSNGITHRIFDIWYKQGQIDIDHEEDTLCAYLVLSLSQVKKEEVQESRKIIRSSDKGHKGAEWTLEHAYWREFGSNASVMELAKDIEEFKSTFKKDYLDAQANSGEQKEDTK
jgi:hypothetical protein